MSTHQRRLSSHYVLTPQGLIPGAILSFDETGMLLGIASSDNIDSEAGVEFFSGLLVPTLIDTSPFAPRGERSFIASKLHSEGVYARARPSGTDSYIPMIDKIKQITGATLTELFSWATLDGAVALGIDDIMGSFEPGKRPGATLITGIDWERGTLLPSAVSKRII